MRVLTLVVGCSLAALPVGAARATPTEADFQISAGTSTDTFFGETTGLDFSAGRFVAAWADNSDALAGNPDHPALASATTLRR